MIRLATRMLRFRKAGFAASFVALFVGSAIVMACGGLMETGIRLNAPPERLAAAPIVVAGQQRYAVPHSDDETATLPERVRINAALAERILAVPGVRRTISDVSFPTGGDTLGHSWESAQLAPYTLVDGHPPTRAGEVVVGGRGTVGDRVKLTVGGRTEPFRLTGIADAPGDARFFATNDALRLAGHPGTADAIGVIPEPGASVDNLADRIEELLGSDARVLTGDDRGFVEFADAESSREDLIVISAVFGGLACMVAMFVVATTLGLSVQQRQREIALLRAVGMTPRQTRRMVLGEAWIVAVLATAASIAPGLLLGRWLFDGMTSNGLAPDEIEFTQGWIPMVAAAGSGILTALVAAVVAARRAGRTRPTEVLAEAALQRRWLSPIRLVLALLCFGGGIALAIVTIVLFDGPIAASTAGPSVMVWAIGLALIAPGITKVLITLLRPLRAVLGMSGRLAILNVNARTVRVAAAMTPIMLATGMATANIYLSTTQIDAAERAFTKDLRADAVLTSSTGLPRSLVDDVRRVPGVRNATEFVSSTGFIEAPSTGQDEEGWQLRGVGADPSLAPPVTGGSFRKLRGHSVVLPDKIDADVGDTITMRLGDRASVQLRVVGLVAAEPGYELIYLPVDLLAPHTTNGLPTQVLVRTDDPAALAALADRYPGVAVADRDVLTDKFSEDQQTQAWVNYLLVGMIVAYTAISVVNTQVIATAQRRREFGLQRLTGAANGQVLRMMTVEGGLVALFGIGLGTLVSMTTLVPFSLAAADSLTPSGPWWIFGVIVGAATVLTMTATLLPTWLTLRSRPIDAAVAAE